LCQEKYSSAKRKLLVLRKKLSCQEKLVCAKQIILVPRKKLFCHYINKYSEKKRLLVLRISQEIKVDSFRIESILDKVSSSKIEGIL